MRERCPREAMMTSSTSLVSSKGNHKNLYRQSQPHLVRRKGWLSDLHQPARLWPPKLDVRMAILQTSDPQEKPREGVEQAKSLELQMYTRDQQSQGIMSTDFLIGPKGHHKNDSIHASLHAQCKKIKPKCECKFPSAPILNLKFLLFRAQALHQSLVMAIVVFQTVA